MTVEDTLGRWKGRFRRVLKRVDMAVEQPDNIPLVNQRERDASNIRDALAEFFTTPEGQTLGSGSE